MKWQTRICLFSLLLCSGCASSLPKVKRVTELAPPANSRLTYDSSMPRQRMITWQPSVHHTNPDFAGYNIYVAKRSLMLASVKTLPLPIVAQKGDTSAVLPNLESETKYFVHVRSRLDNGDLSLPSLPEITFTTD